MRYPRELLRRRLSMTDRVYTSIMLFLFLGCLLFAEGRKDSDKTVQDITNMQPQDVDISNLALTPIESMHSTGTAKLVELASWRLSVTGPAVRTPLALTYGELGQMPTVRKRIILICPGFFWDFLEWDGVPLTELLLKAGVKEFSKVNFISVDGYQASFTRQEVVAHLILIATQGNGAPLPRTQGFPARVVAEDQFGTRWVKYLKDIVVN